MAQNSITIFEEILLRGGFPPLVLKEKPKFIKKEEIKGFKPGKIYVDDYSFSSDNKPLVLYPRGYNKRTITPAFINIVVSLCQERLLRNLSDSLFFGNFRMFYKYLCKSNLFSDYNKDIYIVRETGIKEIPYIITDDIRIILYSYIPYRFKKKDLMLRGEFKNDIKQMPNKNSSRSC